jgi:ABC-type methionine transport system permease subunit
MFGNLQAPLLVIHKIHGRLLFITVTLLWNGKLNLFHLSRNVLAPVIQPLSIPFSLLFLWPLIDSSPLTSIFLGTTCGRTCSIYLLCLAYFTYHNIVLHFYTHTHTHTHTHFLYPFIHQWLPELIPNLGYCE